MSWADGTTEGSFIYAHFGTCENLCKVENCVSRLFTQKNRVNRLSLQKNRATSRFAWKNYVS